jgi:5-(aminomethyl)-3-furanmethanol phosphate kinase
MTGSTTRTVVKVGGSLLGWPELPGRLMAWLETRRAKDRTEGVVLIAGGGAAADWIRSLDQIYRLGQEVAHGLAVHALDLTADVLARLLAGSIVVDRIDMLAAAWESGRTPILAPRNVLNEIERPGTDKLPASWDVTSDSIAARIGEHLLAQSLILLKSASAPVGVTREGAARLGLVDPLLPRAVQSIAHVEIVNLRSETFDRRVLPP